MGTLKPNSSMSIILVMFFVFGSSLGKTLHHKWEVAYMFGAPDCLEDVVMAINGQFPGPTIRAKAGDTVIVELTNNLFTEGVVIHWHGIRQIGTPWADGTAAISQCAINPGESFTYKFLVDKAGTYFYHGHLGMQRSAGLYGPLIVDVAKGKKEEFHYNGEFNLLLSDWWHENVHHQEVGLSSKPFHWIGEPNSLLLNGRGQYNCSLAAKYMKGKNSVADCNFKGNEVCAPSIFSVQPNKTYRLRIASVTALASIHFSIGGHKMMVVEADGNYVEPFETEELFIYSGETYSVLIKTNQNQSHNYWISTSIIARNASATPQGLTILNYLPNPSLKLPNYPPPTPPIWNNFSKFKSFSNKILSKTGTPKPPTTPNRRIYLLNTQNYIDGYIKWALNNVSLVLTSTPYLGAMKFGLKNSFNQSNPPENFPPNYDVMKQAINPNSSYGNGVYRINFNSTVDLILQNANALAMNVSELHPWHLHGHDFWVLGHGEGKFSEGDYGKLNLKNPPARNSAVIFPFGWTVLRFVADNAGVWAFHCHLEPHLHMGMGVVLAVGVDRVKTVPNEAMACGHTAKRFMNTKHR
ncbi:L-ascorbate oxidase-like [Euphorbia lathyris]|uniref:L-ascorbate oxidase-like n=1 Tax=Euphorbia lathyris TaxID=212925 RepID=UPI00331379EE